MKNQNFRTLFPHSGVFLGLKSLLKPKRRECFKPSFVVHFGALWAHLGSNQGPSDYESDALTS